MVSFPTAIAMGFRNYFNFTGTSRRSEYWWFFLFGILLGLVVGFVDGALGLTDANGNGPLGSIVSLGLLIPSLSIYVRRLRDSGRHWANIFWLLIPIAGIVIWIYQLAQPSQHLALDTYGYTRR